MSWCNRRLFLLGTASLAGCGFSPIGQGGHPFQGQITLPTPQNKNEFMLVHRLEDRLGGVTSPTYALQFSISTSSQRTSISSDGKANRNLIEGRVIYTLTRQSDAKVVISGRADAFVGHSTTGSTVATAAAERDAAQRLMIQLADLVTEDLLLRAHEVAQ